MSHNIYAGAGQALRGRHHRTHLVAAAAVVALTLLAAACGSGAGGPGVASAGSNTSTTTGSSGSGAGSSSFNGLKFSQCMRANGVPDFPDPGGSGKIQINGGPGSDLDPSSPGFQAAQKACAKYAPGANLTPAQKAELQAQALKYSQCMRAHGIADFPDPGAGGVISIKGGPGGDLDPNSPAFQAAQKACQSSRPGLKSGGGIQFSISGNATGQAPGNGSGNGPSSPSGSGGAVVAP